MLNGGSDSLYFHHYSGDASSPGPAPITDAVSQRQAEQILCFPFSWFSTSSGFFLAGPESEDSFLGDTMPAAEKFGPPIIASSHKVSRAPPPPWLSLSPAPVPAVRPACPLLAAQAWKAGCGAAKSKVSLQPGLKWGKSRAR